MNKVLSYISEELFHFVGRKKPNDHETNYQLLLRILDDGWITHYPHQHIIADTISFNFEASLESGDLVSPEMTCYCDIPVTSIDIHAAKYGYFGLGLDRARLIFMGARPVTYIPTLPSDWRRDFGTIHGLGLLKDMEHTFRGSYDLIQQHPKNPHARSMGVRHDNFEAAAFALQDVFTRQLAFIKAFNSELPPNHPDNFYMEREWRKVGNFQFTNAEVKAVLVHKDYVEKIRKHRPNFADRIIGLSM